MKEIQYKLNLGYFFKTNFKYIFYWKSTTFCYFAKKTGFQFYFLINTRAGLTWSVSISPKIAAIQTINSSLGSACHLSKHVPKQQSIRPITGIEKIKNCLIFGFNKTQEDPSI